MPTHKFEVIRCWSALGESLQTPGRVEQRDEAFNAVVKLRMRWSSPSRRRRQLASGYAMSGDGVTQLRSAGRFEETAELCRRSLPMAEKLARRFPRTALSDIMSACAGLERHGLSRFLWR